MADLGAIGAGSPMTRQIFGGSISGQVTGAGDTPVSHLIRAYDKVSGLPSGGILSDPVTGNYSLNTGIGFGKSKHVVIEFDPTGDKNARIYDFVVPI